MEPKDMSNTVWLRDLDGTGSMHVCAMGDFGAVAYEPVSDSSAMEWQPIESAPKDGQWFYVLQCGLTVGGGIPVRARPDLNIVRRFKSEPESDGYWQGINGNSIADSYLANSMWATLDALPLHAHYEMRGSNPLPIPFDATTPTT